MSQDTSGVLAHPSPGWGPAPLTREGGIPPSTTCRCLLLLVGGGVPPSPTSLCSLLLGGGVALPPLPTDALCCWGGRGPSPASLAGPLFILCCLRFLSGTVHSTGITTSTLVQCCMASCAPSFSIHTSAARLLGLVVLGWCLPDELGIIRVWPMVDIAFLLLLLSLGLAFLHPAITLAGVTHTSNPASGWESILCVNHAGRPSPAMLAA